MMKLNDPTMLRAYMAQRDMTGAKLGRKADVSRQFVYQLLGGSRQRCNDNRAARIEVALDLIPGTLFSPAYEAALTGAGEDAAAA